MHECHSPNHFPEHFPYLHAEKRMIIVPDKSTLFGDYLIDDMTWNGADRFTGKLIQFKGDWDFVMKEVGLPVFA